MTTWAAGGPTFTLTTDRLAESEACIGDNDLQPAKLAMRVRFPSPAPRTDQLVCPSAQLSAAPSRRLREYFEQTLGGDDAWENQVFDRAWERWLYLVGVTRTYCKITGQARGGVVEGDWPYLRIEDGRDRTHCTTAGKTIRRQVKNTGDGHPLLSKGLCEGSAAVFEGCAKQFDREYGEWGNRRDWEGLTGGRSELQWRLPRWCATAR